MTVMEAWKNSNFTYGVMPNMCEMVRGLLKFVDKLAWADVILVCTHDQTPDSSGFEWLETTMLHLLARCTLIAAELPDVRGRHKSLEKWAPIILEAKFVKGWD